MYRSMYPHSPLALSFQPQRPRVPRLEFVSGSRCLASLWIVCQHFSPHSSDGALVKALWRSAGRSTTLSRLSGSRRALGVAGAFAALQRHRDDAARWRDGAKKWYGRRFGRVLLAATPRWRVVGHGLRQTRVYERPAKVLAPLGLALAALPTAVAVGLLRRGDAPFGRRRRGARGDARGAAALAPRGPHRRRVLPRRRGARAVRPNPRSRYRAGAEELFDHGLAPLFAVFLYCAARDATALEGEPGSIFAALCRPRTPASLGRASFEIYLFQWPLHAAFSAVGLDTKAGGENFAAYVLALCVAAVCYGAYVERPLRRLAPGQFRPLEPLGAAVRVVELAPGALRPYGTKSAGRATRASPDVTPRMNTAAAKTKATSPDGDTAQAHRITWPNMAPRSTTAAA
ncbi:hypothetical protein SO694_00004424 [Aureococcus anophagefferens]|uniref:Acyltransferase 3 domain-containing protein n=1 Tax=Aureococcus anophagefferens TaxID=44056 RepID=A0ABR1G8S8_AURAN